MPTASTSYKAYGTTLNVLITKSYESYGKDGNDKVLQTFNEPQEGKYGDTVKFGFLTVGKAWENYVDAIEKELLYLDIEDETVEKQLYGNIGLQTGFAKKVLGMTEEAVLALAGEGRLAETFKKKTVLGENALVFFNRGVKQAIARLRVGVEMPGKGVKAYGFGSGVLERKEGNWGFFLEDQMPKEDKWKSQDMTGIKATMRGRLHLGIYPKKNPQGDLLEVRFTLDFKMDTGDALFMPKERIEFKGSPFDKLNAELNTIHSNMTKEEKVAAHINKAENDETDAFDLDGFDPLGEVDEVEAPKPKKVKKAEVVEEVDEDDEDDFVD